MSIVTSQSSLATQGPSRAAPRRGFPGCGHAQGKARCRKWSL